MNGTPQGRHVHRLLHGRNLVRRLLECLLVLNLVDEAARPVIREHVVDVPFADTLLVLLPENPDQALSAAKKSQTRALFQGREPA